MSRGSDAAAQITRRRGGSAANVAVAAVAAGGSARFIGAVGEDATAEALEVALLRAGVEPLLQRGGRSASIVVVVEPDGLQSSTEVDSSATPYLCIDIAPPGTIAFRPSQTMPRYL
jgi:sugar/nucleoside kinase (ribokinase family)